MRPDYKNAMKFSDTNYTADGIDLDEIDADYQSKVNHIYSIGNIYITGAGYVDYPFACASPESAYGWDEFVWEKTPSRNLKFVFNTMDDIEIGKVARCEINIKYMNYEDYLVFREIVNSERHFLVKFFNVDQNAWVARDMYCAENSKSKLYTLKESLIGVLDLSIKLVGTNLDIKDDETLLSVSYNLGDGSGTTPATLSNITKGTQIELAGNTGINPPQGKYLAGWQTFENGKVSGSYGKNQSITLWESLALYAWYKDAE